MWDMLLECRVKEWKNETVKKEDQVWGCVIHVAILRNNVQPGPLGSIFQHCSPPERKLQHGSMAPSAHHMSGALVPLHSRLLDQDSFYKIKKRTEGRHQKLDKISLNSPEQSTTATNETRSGQWGGNMDTESSALPYTSFLGYTLREEFQSNAPMLFPKNQSFSVFL